MTVRHITDLAGARGLAEHLLSESRSRPVCVVTVPEAQPDPWIDVALLQRELGDRVEVVVIPSGPLTMAVSAILPDKANVFGGAGRVYPVDASWQDDPYSIPLAFCRAADDGPRATQRLIQDAQRHWGTTSGNPRSDAQTVEAEVRMLLPPTSALAMTADGSACTVSVEQFGQGLTVEQVLRTGQRISGRLRMSEKVLMPDTADIDRSQLDRYSVGSVVLSRVAEVQLDRAMVELVPSVQAVLARDDVTGNHIDRLSSLLSKGDVVATRVLRVGVPGGKPWKVGTADVDDDETPLPAPSLTVDGPPWLTESMVLTRSESADATSAAPSGKDEHAEPAEGPPRHQPGADGPRPELSTEASPDAGASSPGPVGGVVSDSSPPAADSPDSERGASEPDPVEAPASAAPEPGSGLALRLGELEAVAGDLQRDLVLLRREHAALVRRVDSQGGAARSEGIIGELVRVERDEAREEARRLTERLRQVEQERDRLREGLTGARRDISQLSKRLRRGGPRATDTGPLFLDPEAELRWAVQRRWVERVPAAEKEHLPLGPYAVGDEFLQSLEQVHGLDRDKVADVVVDIATGRVHSVTGYQTHRLRESEESNRYVSREDGATCWRVSLQVNSPSARRLHFWQPPGGVPELSSVRLHDDTRP